MRTVLVTGASGFIGSHCLNALIPHNVRIVAASRSAPEWPSADSLEWVPLDLMDRGAVKRVLSSYAPTDLLHLAWFVEPGKVINHPDNLTWVGASLDLIRAFRESGGARCVVAGSGYEYDWNAGRCVEGVTPCNPDTLYGVAKDALRRIFEHYCGTTGLSWAWGRAFFMYGPHEHPQRLVSSVVRSLLQGQEARTSHGLLWRDYMHVQDVANGLVALLMNDVNGVFNVASGQAVTIRSIVERIGQLLGREDLLRIGALPARANDVESVVGDAARITSATGWRPVFDLDAGLQQTIDWWRQRCASGVLTQ